MKIGYACVPLMVPYKTTRKLTLASYTEDKARSLIKENLTDLLSILIYNNSKGIKLFRISSDIIPFGSHSINTIPWQKEFSDTLNQIGQYIINNDLRVSMHPGQYTLLNSPKKDVVEKSILDLDFHCNFLDSLNLPTSHKIILHVGGLYGDKKNATSRFIREYSSLPKNIKDRLTIENDERFFSIYDLLEINSEINIPLIFDNLHYECFNDFSLPVNEILPLVKNTWSKNDGDMKIHFSQQDITKKIGAHSPTILINPFLDFLNQNDFSNIDFMLEVKDKDVSAIKVINSLKSLNSDIDSDTFLLELYKYKLFFLERLGEKYIDIINNCKVNNNLLELYNCIDSLIYTNAIDNYKLSLDYAFNMIEDKLNNKEISHYFKYYTAYEYSKCKEYLKKLSAKHKLSLNDTYYFIY